MTFDDGLSRIPGLVPLRGARLAEALAVSEQIILLALKTTIEAARASEVSAGVACAPVRLKASPTVRLSLADVIGKISLPPACYGRAPR